MNSQPARTSETWRTRARYVCRHLRRRNARLGIIVLAWQAGAGSATAEAASSIGADALATTAEQALQGLRDLGLQPLLPEEPAEPEEQTSTRSPLTLAV